MAKREASAEYQLELETTIKDTEFMLRHAKDRLYKVVADAKLGEPEFETNRAACLLYTTTLKKATIELERVKKELQG